MTGPSPTTILRVASRRLPYSQLGNDMIRDPRLSPEAVGVLAFILSHPADWQFTFAWLCQARGIGRDRARRIIKELVEAGYCSRHRSRQPDGTMAPYEYRFTDDPQGAATTDGFPVTGEPAPVNPPRTKNRESKHCNKSGRHVENGGDADRSLKSNSDDQRRPAREAKFVSEEALAKVRGVAPGWDRQHLLALFLDKPENRKGLAHLRSPDAAFLAWVKKYTRGRPPGASDDHRRAN